MAINGRKFNKNDSGPKNALYEVRNIPVAPMVSLEEEKKKKPIGFPFFVLLLPPRPIIPKVVKADIDVEIIYNEREDEPVTEPVKEPISEEEPVGASIARPIEEPVIEEPIEAFPVGVAEQPEGVEWQEVQGH